MIRCAKSHRDQLCCRLSYMPSSLILVTMTITTSTPVSPLYTTAPSVNRTHHDDDNEHSSCVPYRWRDTGNTMTEIARSGPSRSARRRGSLTFIKHPGPAGAHWRCVAEQKRRHRGRKWFQNPPLKTDFQLT